MEKLMKNWIFTLVVGILLAVLTVLMILGALDIVPLARDILHIIAAVILVLYIVFALWYNMLHYRGTVQAFAIGEVAILSLVAAGLVFRQFQVLSFLSGMQVFQIVGLAMWLRGTVEIVHAYLMHGTNAKHPITLAGLCGYIALSAVGMWQLAAPLIRDKHILWVIGFISLVATTIFLYATVKNRGRLPKKEKKKKEEKKKEEAVAALPAAEKEEEKKA